jgi:hypothetical protein
MLSDRTKFSLVTATIAALGTINISPAQAISFRFTNLPSCRIYTTVPGLVFHGTDCFAGHEGIAGIFVGDINEPTVTGGVAVTNNLPIVDSHYSWRRDTPEIVRLGDVGSGYFFGGNYVSPIPSGQGEFLFRVQGNAFSLRGAIYVLSFTCNLGIDRSCNGAKGSFAIRYFSTTKHELDIVLSDFSWSNTLSLPPFPTPTNTPTQSPTETPTPTNTPTSSPEAASIPEPSSVAGLFLLGSAWLLRRKRKQTFPTGISESLN